jgi:hypothetical protein
MELGITADPATGRPVSALVYGELDLRQAANRR